MRLEVEAGHLAHRADVGAAEDVADLAERREGHLGVVRIDAEKRAHRGGARAGSKSRTTVALEVADDAEHDGRDVVLGGADRVDGVGQIERQRPAAPSGRPVRPSMLESAVAAVPEPIFAISRSPSSCMSVSSISRSSCRVCKFGRCCAGRAAGAAGLGQRVAVHDQADRPVREHRPARQAGLRSGLGRERSCHQLALADERSTTSARRRSAPRAMTTKRRLGRRLVPERLGQVDQREHAVRQHQHAPPGDRAHGLLGEVDACARPARAGSRTAPRRSRRAGPA